MIAPSPLLTDLTHLQVLKETGCDFFFGGVGGGVVVPVALTRYTKAVTRESSRNIPKVRRALSIPGLEPEPALRRLDLPGTPTLPSSPVATPSRATSLWTKTSRKTDA